MKRLELWESIFFCISFLYKNLLKELLLKSGIMINNICGWSILYSLWGWLKLFMDGLLIEWFIVLFLFTLGEYEWLFACVFIFGNIISISFVSKCACRSWHLSNMGEGCVLCGQLVFFGINTLNLCDDCFLRVVVILMTNLISFSKHFRWILSRSELIIQRSVGSLF